MNVYQQDVMNELARLVYTVDFNTSHQDELEMMTENNWKQEKKKRGKRSRELVKEHTATGLGAEIAIASLPYFAPVSDIVEDANTLNFVDRMKDYKYLLEEGVFGQIKTMNLKYPDLRWYISFAQLESMLLSKPHNRDLLIVGYNKLGELKYEYKPVFLINMDAVVSPNSRYVKPDRNSQFDSMIFDWRKAVADDVCVRFTD